LLNYDDLLPILIWVGTKVGTIFDASKRSGWRGTSTALAYPESKFGVISADEARYLVRADLASFAKKTSQLSIQRGSDDYAFGLYFFSVYGPRNPAGSSTIGHFLVDPKTGDVFDGVVCKEYKAPTLAKLQNSIRKRIGLSRADYLKLKRPIPMCDESKQSNP